jgi:hypothetical protein
MTTSCKLIIYYPNDLKILTGNITDLDNFQITLNEAADDVFDNCIYTKLKWYSGDEQFTASVELVSSENGVYTFKLAAQDIIKETEYRHSIEFNEYFEAVLFDKVRLSEFRHKTDQLNNRFRSTLTTQIKKIITDETLTNQYLFKLLMQIDAKMDELLGSLKEDEAVEGLKVCHVLSLGGSGIIFRLNDKNVNAGDMIYVQSLPKHGLGINFAAVCKITDVIALPDGAICEAAYEYADESTVENIIHFIFQKDRETLKRKKV